MNSKTLRLLVVLFCVAFFIAGCEPERDLSPIFPGETAVLVLTFTPNPVYEGYGNKYRFTVFIDEINGVGARIGSIKMESVGAEGIVLKTDTYNESQVIRAFVTSRIEAYGRLMANVVLDDCYECEMESWLVRADDDYGNHVEYSGSVELIAR